MPRDGWPFDGVMLGRVLASIQSLFLRSITMTRYGILLCNRSIPENPGRSGIEMFFPKWISRFWNKGIDNLYWRHESFKINSRNGSEREAVLYFKIGALCYKIPFCKYLYGHALIYGTGGTKKDIVMGMGLLHEAGNELCIAEAFFELGVLYEHGVMGKDEQCIAKDYVMAQGFYEDSIKAAFENIHDENKSVWIPPIGIMNQLLHVDSVHLQEDSVHNDAGMHYSWIILGHSFLFSTAATIASKDYHQAYSPLLLLLPILGIVLAGYSIFDTLMACDVIERNQNQVEKMLTSKFDAYNEIISFIKKKLKQ